MTWYSIIVVFAGSFVIFLNYFVWKNNKLPAYHFWIIFFIMPFIAIYGGYWWYLIFSEYQISTALEFFTPMGGRSIIGCVVAAVSFMWLYIHFWGGVDLEFRKAFNIIVPSFLLAQAIGRWGNFTNQEIYGQVVDDLSHLPVFIQQGMYIDGAYRQPLFLIESISMLIAWLLIVFVVPSYTKAKIGVCGGLYFVAYGSIRASMELFRDPEFIMMLGPVPTSFMWAIIFIFFGLFVVYYYQFLYEKSQRYLSSTFYLESKPVQIKTN